MPAKQAAKLEAGPFTYDLPGAFRLAGVVLEVPSFAALYAAFIRSMFDC
jgi:hypothetical protein